VIEQDGFRESSANPLEGRSALPATLNPFGLRFGVRSPAGSLVSPLPGGARD
jgi:hypothetical protein